MATRDGVREGAQAKKRGKVPEKNTTVMSWRYTLLPAEPLERMFYDAAIRAVADTFKINVKVAL